MARMLAMWVMFVGLLKTGTISSRLRHCLIKMPWSLYQAALSASCIVYMQFDDLYFRNFAYYDSEINKDATRELH